MPNSSINRQVLRYPKCYVIEGVKHSVFDASAQIGPLLLLPKREKPQPPPFLSARGGTSVGNMDSGGRWTVSCSSVARALRAGRCRNACRTADSGYFTCECWSFPQNIEICRHMVSKRTSRASSAAVHAWRSDSVRQRR